MADTPLTNPTPAEVTQATKYQPGTDLGDALRADNPTLTAYNHPNIPVAQNQPAGNPPDLNAAAAPAAPAAAPHSNLATRFATHALNIIGGAPSVRYTPDGKGGVIATSVPKTGMEIVRGLLTAGLTGLQAGGEEQKKTGSALASLGAGYVAADASQRKVDKEAYDRAQKASDDVLKGNREQREQSREEREQAEFEDNQRQRKFENARLMAADIRTAATYEKNMQLMDQRIATGDYNFVQQQVNTSQAYADRMLAIKHAGGEVMKVNGVPAPEFEHLGEAEDYGNANLDHIKDADKALHFVMNPSTRKWTVMEIPYEAPKWFEITDAAGQKQRVFTDTDGLLAKEEEVAKTKHYQNIASKSSLDIKKELEEYKEEGTVKGARKELNKVGGDISKLPPGSKEALLGDAEKRFTMANIGLEKELSKPDALRDENTVKLLTEQRNQFAQEVSDYMRPSWVAAPGSPGVPKTGAKLDDKALDPVATFLQTLPAAEQLATINGSAKLTIKQKTTLIEHFGLGNAPAVGSPAAAAPAAAPEEEERTSGSSSVQ